MLCCMPLKNRKINFSQKYPLRQRWVGETAKYIYERLNYFCKHDGPGPGHKLGSADSEAEKKLVFNQILQNYLSIAYKPWASRVFGLPPTWVLSGSNMPIQKKIPPQGLYRRGRRRRIGRGHWWRWFSGSQGRPYGSPCNESRWSWFLPSQNR